MLRGIVDNFIFFLLSPSACPQLIYLFLSFICPSFHSAAIERMFTSRCLCAIIRQCRITALSLNSCSLLLFLFCLIVIAASALYIPSTCIGQVTTLHFKLVPICSEGAIASLLCTTHFYFLYKECCYSSKDNQVTRSEEILLKDTTDSHCAACEKVRW